MQLVIDIDEYDYEKVKELVSEGVFDYEGTTAHLFKSVVNGTPLPKGHGRLIEASKLLDTDRIIVDNSRCHYIPMIDVYEAPTIIEADKGDE